MSVVMKNQKPWRSRVMRALIVFAIAVPGAFVVAAPASAAPADCASGYHCNYSGYNYGNDAFQGPSTHRFKNCVDEMYIGLRSYGNITSSAFNNGNSQRSYLYSGPGRTGSSISFDKKTGTANLGTRGFNDTAESGYFQSTLGSAGSALCR